MIRKLSFALLVLLPASVAPALAQSELEARLRDALRQATAQARTLEDENARLKAQQSQLESQLALLRQQVEAAASQATAADRSSELERAYRAAVDEFNQRLQQERDQVIRSLEAMEKWKTAYNEAAAVARSRETEREQLAGQLRAAAEREAVCRERNEALFTVGNEILDRWQETGWADILAAKEPFLGLKRVELENLAQDEADRLLDNRLSTITAAPAPAAPAAEPAR
jgi:DNA repair exonuclease SbcCD ATPase subunit